MACIDQDPSDFSSGVLDPSDDPSPLTSELFVSDGRYVDTASPYMEFEINVSPANYAAAVQFDWATSNGTASSGLHYTAGSGHITIAAGSGIAIIQITVLKPNNVSGTKTFTLTISTPVNATINDGTGVGTIKYGTQDPPPTDPGDNSSMTVWPGGVKVVYNEFPSHCNECTGFSVAALLSSHAYLDKGTKVTYDAHELFSGSGSSTKASVGHSWLLVGWNNNVQDTGRGGFIIQSSHGGGWANGGRAWLPYSLINTRQSKNCLGSGCFTDPWYRFFWAKIKPGG
jgi:hypothetical protein